MISPQKDRGRNDLSTERQRTEWSLHRKAGHKGRNLMISPQKDRGRNDLSTERQDTKAEIWWSPHRKTEDWMISPQKGRTQRQKSDDLPTERQMTEWSLTKCWGRKGWRLWFLGKNSGRESRIRRLRRVLLVRIKCNRLAPPLLPASI